MSFPGGRQGEPSMDWGTPGAQGWLHSTIVYHSHTPAGLFCNTMIWLWERFKLSKRFKSLSSFFWILISSFCSSWRCLILPFVPNCCFESGFLPVTVGYLYILLYFILGIFHLFFHFSTKLNKICEHFDYQGLKFSIRWVGYLFII